MNVECHLAFKAYFVDALPRMAGPLRKRTVDVVAQLNVPLPRPRTNALDPRRTFSELRSGHSDSGPERTHRWRIRALPPPRSDFHGGSTFTGSLTRWPGMQTGSD